jgi:hypothetical protein
VVPPAATASAWNTSMTRFMSCTPVSSRERPIGSGTSSTNTSRSDSVSDRGVPIFPVMGTPSSIGLACSGSLFGSRSTVAAAACCAE